MTTTIMKNSIVGDAWIQQAYAAVPIQPVLDEATGQPTGNFLTGPVRLSWDTLFELPQPTKDTPNPKYGATLLFPPVADFAPLYKAYYDQCAKDFADHYDANTQQYYGVHSPFRDQAEKMKFNGYTPGCVFMNVSTQYKPPVVDARGNPIVDRSKVYPGVWAVCAINPYSFFDSRKKGVNFGLQSVMIVGDDENIGGRGADPDAVFAAAKGAITMPTAAITANMPAGGGHPPAGSPTMPSAPPGGTFASHAPSPASGSAPAALGTPPGSMPGAHTAAPAANAPIMPGQPAADPRGPVPGGYSSWAEYDQDMASL